MAQRAYGAGAVSHGMGADSGDAMAPAPASQGGGVSSQGSGSLPRDPSADFQGPSHTDWRPNPVPAPRLFGLGVVFKKSDGEGGMLVKRVNAGAAAAGVLHAGDRVLAINGTPLDHVQDAMHLARLTHGSRGSSAILHVRGAEGGENEVLVVRGD
mmetsp:Transcript_49812/g.118594  ORF Transcript_49812/g.118594 Transcript_49812/m.118594 type:complete len:155 (-) Transcript_49812:66-530(-)